MARREPGLGSRSRRRPLVQLSRVSVVLGGVEVLRDLSWRVERGEHWVVVGPNGAGKTSLLRLLNGYVWPARGEVIILGRRFGTVDLRELRREIGFVSPYVDEQIPREERALDVVASGLSASTRSWRRPGDRALAYAALVARRAGCGAFLSKMYGQLSQGEKRRVAIARALMAKPSMITLDEPSAGLDLTAREGLMSSLSRMSSAEARTMVYVTHRIDEIPSGFTHALLLRAGEVVAQGRIGGTLNGANLSRCFGTEVRVRRWRGRFYAVAE